MINGKYHYEDEKVVIDAAYIGNGRIEVMKFRQRDEEELDSFITYDLAVAENVYNKMVEEHTKQDAPLTGKYAKLRDDLKAAIAAGYSAAAAVEDTGTCNLDAASLFLPRWNQKLVERAAKEAGTRCFSWHLFGCKRYVFNTPNVGQARKNEEAAEAMTKVLAAAGYDAFCYQQMD